MTERRYLQLLTGPAYILSVLLIVVPISEALLNVAQPRLGDVYWRFGIAGILSSAALLPVGGLLLGLAASIAGERKWVSGMYALLSAVGGVAFVGAIGMFTLDALQIRGEIPAAGTLRFDVNVIRALVLQLTFALVLLWMSYAGIRSMRQKRQVRRLEPENAASAATMLVVPSSGR